MLRLKTAQNTYNELLTNINKFESIEDFLKECGYIYDATLYYICDCLELKCDDGRYRYLDNCVTKELDWEELYEGVHECDVENNTIKHEASIGAVISINCITGSNDEFTSEWTKKLNETLRKGNSGI